MSLVNILSEMTAGCKNLSEIVDTFEHFCKENMQESNHEEIMLLFETGTFGCIGEKMFQISLVRQWANEDEEYCQLHLKALYQPSESTAVFSGAVWDEDLDDDFFAYIRKSPAYLALEQAEIAKVTIYQDET